MDHGLTRLEDIAVASGCGEDVEVENRLTRRGDGVDHRTSPRVSTQIAAVPEGG